MLKPVGRSRIANVQVGKVELAPANDVIVRQQDASAGVSANTKHSFM